MKEIVILPSPAGKRIFLRLAERWAKRSDAIVIGSDLSFCKDSLPPDRILIYAENVRRLGGGTPIVVAAEDCHTLPGLPENAVLIAPYALFERVSPAVSQVIGCGPGPKESVTFSSLGPDGAVISFQRNIRLPGEYHSIAPCDIPLHPPESFDTVELLLFAAVLAVTGELESADGVRLALSDADDHSAFRCDFAEKLGPGTRRSSIENDIN